MPSPGSRPLGSSALARRCAAKSGGERGRERESVCVERVTIPRLRSAGEKETERGMIVAKRKTEKTGEKRTPKDRGAEEKGEGTLVQFTERRNKEIAERERERENRHLESEFVDLRVGQIQAHRVPGKEVVKQLVKARQRDGTRQLALAAGQAKSLHNGGFLALCG